MTAIFYKIGKNTHQITEFQMCNLTAIAAYDQATKLCEVIILTEEEIKHMDNVILIPHSINLN